MQRWVRIVIHNSTLFEMKAPSSPSVLIELVGAWEQ